jgi:hypothetical protein
MIIFLAYKGFVLIANIFDLSSISVMGSAGFLLIFAAVNAANTVLAKETEKLYHPFLIVSRYLNRRTHGMVPIIIPIYLPDSFNILTKITPRE